MATNILIDKLRVDGFRGLKDFEISLEPITILTGVNNCGKTSILKSLQLALGSRAFLSYEDLNISGGITATKIIVDIRIVPLNSDGSIAAQFSEDWEEIFGTSIKPDPSISYVPIRTEITYNTLKSTFESKQMILNEWENNDSDWKNITSRRASFDSMTIPFYYLEAQRDVVDDLKLKTSYIGKMLADIAQSYREEDITALEELISGLNEQAISSSNILSIVQDTLSGINTTVDTPGSTVSVSPFAKRIRDLSKSFSVHYGAGDDSFTMDYHGMGTRSWSSLLTFKAFILHNSRIASEETQMFFPIIAIEEPESHLHPNAQKQLYQQMCDMPGQKIISTHSPYIAASGELSEIRSISNNKCGQLSGLEDTEGNRKLKQKVIHTRGEVFFSKALVLFEGETEEQALPILAEKYFGRPAFELGIDFIGVGGAGQYGPFIRFANDFNIPWYIFSDGEAKPLSDVSKAVKKIKGDEFTQITDEDNVFIIANSGNFESMLINDGFVNEIEQAIMNIRGTDYITKYISRTNGSSKGRTKTSSTCDKCGQNIYIDEIRNYAGKTGYLDALLDIISNCKTDFGPAIASQIIASGKEIPQSILSLYEKIKQDSNG